MPISGTQTTIADILKMDREELKKLGVKGVRDAAIELELLQPTGPGEYTSGHDPRKIESQLVVLKEILSEMKEALADLARQEQEVTDKFIADIAAEKEEWKWGEEVEITL